MSDYHRDQDDRNGSGLPWPFVIIAFFVFWPVGVFLLLLKLSQDSKFKQQRADWLNALNHVDDVFAQSKGDAAQRQAQRQAERHARYGHIHEQTKGDTVNNAAPQQSLTPEEKIRQQAQQQAERRAEQKRANKRRSKRRSPTHLKSGNCLSGAGGLLAAFFGLITCSSFFGWISTGLFFAIEQALVPFFFTGVGAGLFAWGRFRNRQSKRLRRMLNMIGNQTTLDIRQLAEAMGTTYPKACDDIQDLIDGGYLGNRAYINMATGQLFLDTDGFQSVVKPQPPKPEPVDHDAALLAEIRQLDEDIDDEEMSRKIRRIEECTEHILEYLKKHPEKSSELHTFLDYYLPTTLKILHSYAELEEQGVEGDNISTTKARIETMMDGVVEGFEAQLDRLFEGSMMDISADISVMEKMLSRDGLSGGMKMPKVPTEPETAPEAVPYTPTLTLDPNGNSGAAVQTMPEEASK